MGYLNIVNGSYRVFLNYSAGSHITVSVYVVITSQMLD